MRRAGGGGRRVLEAAACLSALVLGCSSPSNAPPASPAAASRETSPSGAPPAWPGATTGAPIEAPSGTAAPTPPGGSVPAEVAVSPRAVPAAEVSVAPPARGGAPSAASPEPRGALGPLPGPHIPRGPPVARVRAFAPTLDPAEALSRDIVERVVQRHRAELGECLERELSASPELTGRLVVRFVIALGGSVSAAELVTSSLGAGGSASDATHARSCEACVLSLVRRWVFPTPDGVAVTVTQPLSLEAAEPMLPSTGEPPDPGALLGGDGSGS